MMKLEVEYNSSAVKDEVIKTGEKHYLMVTPAIGEDYWIMRVRLTPNQAIVCFPKFFTIGCGFQKEEDDWNTNLPIACPSEQIYNHIKRNKGDSKITKAMCLRAIDMLREAAIQTGGITRKDVARMEDQYAKDPT